jgi:hypothetical protein
MFEKLIQSPWLGGNQQVKLRVHMAAFNWVTGDLGFMYELLSAQETIIHTGSGHLPISSLGNKSLEEIQQAAIEALGYVAV